MEFMGIDLPLHTQQVILEKDTSQRRKKTLKIMGMSPSYVCNRGVVFVAIHMSKIIHYDADATPNLKNSENEVLNLTTYQVKEHSVGYEKIKILLTSQHLALSLISYWISE